MSVLKVVRWVSITMGVIILTSFTVDATLNGNQLSQSALGILATSVVDEVAICPEGMVELGGEDGICVDVFEASPSESCEKAEVLNGLDTVSNIHEQSCVPASKEGARPWAFVTQHQARELCVRAGKRLPTNAEWYQASVGTPDNTNEQFCNTDSGSVSDTGSNEGCRAPSGVYDMIGNVWEWVEGDVFDQEFDGRALPESGYVSNADSTGIALETSDTPDRNFNADFVWSESDGTFGMMRGGFYRSREDAGVFTLQAKTVHSFSGEAVGFRCVSDI